MQSLHSSASQTRLDVRYARFGPFVVDLQRRAVYKNDVDLGLCGDKYEFLCALIEKRDGIVLRNELCDRLWQSSGPQRSKQLNVLAEKVRRVLGVGFNEPAYIETVRSKEYKLFTVIEFSNVPSARSLPILKSRSIARVEGMHSYFSTGRLFKLGAVVFLVTVSLIGIALENASTRVSFGPALA
jgi:DNA-binding winged helix-turn-helix (wHTH) protein